jgi:hypothetical protein
MIFLYVIMRLAVFIHTKRVLTSQVAKYVVTNGRQTDVRLCGRSIELEHLDIAAYLSAPNGINTCNKHVRTVYRIFNDLSDMS